MLGAGQAGAAEPATERAVFAGGCFWCMVHPFDQLPGVKEVLSGYTGGAGVDPSYEDYAAKGHVEAIEITYDPAVISYEKLLDIYWRQVDPTDPDGQFVDRGPQYTTAIFYTTPAQKKIAEASKAALAASGRYDKPLVTPVSKAAAFYKAEAYHQYYYKKNPLHYKYYRYRSGRDNYLEKIWGKPAQADPPEKPADKSSYKKPSQDELLNKLTPLQYEITQRGGTEPAFKNEYWDNHLDGIYVDIVSGEPLFSSLDKFDSGTGWPSFTRPLEPYNVVEAKKWCIFGRTTEVRSRNADSHLGDLFNDGPQPTGLRYCIDSAALRFIPREKLKEEGYGKYLRLFESKTK